MPVSSAAIVFYCYFPVVLVHCLIFCVFLLKLYSSSDNNKRKISKLQQRLHILCLLCILFTSICDTVHAFGGMITNTGLYVILPWIQVFHVGADIFYFGSSLLLYIILIERLYSTFRNTAYEISSYVLWILCVLIALQALLMIAYCINIGYFGCSKAIYCRITGIEGLSITLIDYVLNIILFSMFILKLRDLVNSRCHDDDLQFNKRKHVQFINVITKQMIIGTMIVLCNQGFGTAVFISQAIDETSSDVDLIFVYLTRAVEGVFIAILLYLGLYRNQNEYMLVCGQCHAFCNRCCVQKMLYRRNTRTAHYELLETN